MAPDRRKENRQMKRIRIVTVFLLSALLLASCANTPGADLAAAAAAYLKGLGMTDAEIDALRANLAKNYES